MSPLIFSLGTVGPVFLIIAIGVLLRRFGLIDPGISSQLTRLVFHLFLPALLLRALLQADFGALLSLRLAAAVLGTLFVSYAGAWTLARLAGANRETQGIFASGATWGNVAIVGYALGEALYGEAGLARAAIFSALVLPFHTPMGFLAMGRGDGSGGKDSLGIVLLRLIRNPIILTIIIGLTLNLILGADSAGMPVFVMDVLGILARASLPLALVAIGGSLEFSRDPAGWIEPLGAAAVKLLVMPGIAFAAARLAGLDAAWTGSMVIGFSCPTAVSFFVISGSLGHESSRGAAIVTVTTVGAAVTVGVVAILLKAAGLV